MKKLLALGAAGVLTLVMGTSVFAASSGAVSARSYAAGGLVGHHVEHFGGHYTHYAGLPGCSFSDQFCWTSAGYSVGNRVTEAPAPSSGQQASGGQQAVSNQTYTQGSSGGQQAVANQTYTQGNSGGYVSSGSYGSGQGYGGNYTDSNSNGVCDYWEDGSCYGYGNGSGGYGYGNGGGHHGGGHHGGCRW